MSTEHQPIEAVPFPAEKLAAMTNGPVFIPNPHAASREVVVYGLGGGNFDVRVGCQRRSLQRWLQYGHAVATEYGIPADERRWLSDTILAVAKALSVPVPEVPGVEPFDWEEDDMEGDDEEDDDCCDSCGEPYCDGECEDDDDDSWDEDDDSDDDSLDDDWDDDEDDDEEDHP